MQGRTAVLGLAAVLTLTLTSCGVRSEADRGTETGRLRSSQAEQDMVRNGRTMLEDGSYYAGTDGAVDRVRPEHESEWEKLGRDLRDGWDHLMNGTEEAVDQTGRAAKRAGQGAKDAADQGAAALLSQPPARERAAGSNLLRRAALSRKPAFPPGIFHHFPI